MTLEQLVPSLDICQQLRDKGFPQDTALVWVNAPQGFISGGGLYMDKDGIHRNPETPSKGYADEVMLRSAVNTLHTVLCGAPTAGELEECDIEAKAVLVLAVLVKSDNKVDDTHSCASLEGFFSGGTAKP